MTKGYTSTARVAYFTALLKLWVRSNRPDIFEAITKESYKKFPQLKIKNRNLAVLPESLQGLK